MSARISEGTASSQRICKEVAEAGHTQGTLRTAKDVQDWSVSNDECGSTAYTDLTDENGTVIALVVVGEKSPWGRPDPRPNTRRLVACWNACDGISTETLEGEASNLHEWLEKKRIEAIDRAEVNLELKAQRDELVAALAFYANPGDYKDPFTGGRGKLYFDCGEMAREAIAKVTP